MKFRWLMVIFVVLSGFVPIQSNAQVSDVIPIVRIAPQYPFMALLSQTEGWVKVKMHINARGSVDRVEVVDAEPLGLFDREAIRAAMKFKFKPKVVDRVVMASVATQRFDFDLPKSNNPWQKSPVVELMREQIEALPANYGRVVLADSVRIKSKIKPKGVQSVDVYFDDDQFQLNAEPHIWGGHEAATQNVSDFDAQLARRQSLVNEQYAKLTGIYKRFHRIQTAEKHPPVLLNTVDLLVTELGKTAKAESYQLTIDETGKVVKWKSLHDPDLNKRPYLIEYTEEWLSQLRFEPALKKGKPVKDKITIEFKSLNIGRVGIVKEAIHNNKQHTFAKPWVKRLAHYNPAGDVTGYHILASSDEAFEESAQKPSPVKRNKPNNRWQDVQLVEFDLREE